MMDERHLLSAHLFLSPKWAGSQLPLASNLSGRYSLSAMAIGGTTYLSLFYRPASALP